MSIIRGISQIPISNLLIHISSLKQGTMSVVEYLEEFHTLSYRVEVDEPEYITLLITREVFTSQSEISYIFILLIPYYMLSKPIIWNLLCILHPLMFNQWRYCLRHHLQHKVLHHLSHAYCNKKCATMS